MYSDVDEGTYILQSLLGLNLHNRNKRIVGLQQILALRHISHGAHGKWAAEPSLAYGRELGRFNQFSCVVDRVEQGNDDAMRAGIQGACAMLTDAH